MFVLYIRKSAQEIQHALSQIQLKILIQGTLLKVHTFLKFYCVQVHFPLSIGPLQNKIEFECPSQKTHKRIATSKTRRSQIKKNYLCRSIFEIWQVFSNFESLIKDKFWTERRSFWKSAFHNALYIMGCTVTYACVSCTEILTGGVGMTQLMALWGSNCTDQHVNHFTGQRTFLSHAWSCALDQRATQRGCSAHA